MISLEYEHMHTTFHIEWKPRENWAKVFSGPNGYKINEEYNFSFYLNHLPS